MLSQEAKELGLVGKVLPSRGGPSGIIGCNVTVHETGLHDTDTWLLDRCEEPAGDVSTTDTLVIPFVIAQVTASQAANSKPRRLRQLCCMLQVLTNVRQVAGNSHRTVTRLLSTS